MGEEPGSTLSTTKLWDTMLKEVHIYVYLNGNRGFGRDFLVAQHDLAGFIFGLLLKLKKYGFSEGPKLLDEF